MLDVAGAATFHGSDEPKLVSFHLDRRILTNAKCTKLHDQRTPSTYFKRWLSREVVSAESGSILYALRRSFKFSITPPCAILSKLERNRGSA
jgi:hypothetical protein